MEYKSLTSRVGYLKGPTNIGVLIDGKNAILIDSGSDDAHAKMASESILSLGLTPIALLNTHAHADHCGGNAYFIKEFHLPVYAPTLEAALIEQPIFQTFFLFSGAYPLKKVRENKLLTAKPSKVNFLFSPGELLKIGNLKISTLPLFGHTAGQTGYLIDDVFFVGDAIFEKHLIDKHKIAALCNIGAQKESLHILDNAPAKFYVPSHFEHFTDIDEYTLFLREYMKKIENLLLSFLKDGDKTTEELYFLLCEALSLRLVLSHQYLINRYCLIAFLTNLSDTGKITLKIRENKDIWRLLEDPIH